MKLKSVSFLMFACILIFFVFQSQVWAPPSPCDIPYWCDHYHWDIRSCEYAITFCNGTNPEYGRSYWTDTLGVDHIADCADFCSQIANAGCSGMAESNNTNWEPCWVPRNRLDCWSYYNNEPDWQTLNDCNPDWIHFDSCSTGVHMVMVTAWKQSWWFFCSNYDWLDEKVDADDTTDIPDWAGPGCFAFRRSTAGQWHAVFIGWGPTGRRAHYYAHTNDRCGSPVTGLFIPTPDHVEFYGPVCYSPMIVSTRKEEK